MGRVADKPCLSELGAYGLLGLPLWGMATKLAFAIAVGMAYPLLELAGFDAKSQHNDATGLWTLAMLYAGLPVAVKLGVVCMMWNFPLDRARHAELQKRLGAVG